MNYERERDNSNEETDEQIESEERGRREGGKGLEGVDGRS